MDWIRAHIKAARKKKGFSQEQMADLLNVEQATYSNWETGKTDLTLTQIERVAVVLEVDVKEFWDPTRFEPKDPSEVITLELYKQLLQGKEEMIEQLKENNALLKEQLAEFKTKKKNGQ